MPGEARPPLARLTKRSDFLAAAKGRRFHTDRMSVQGLVREGPPGGLRVGLTVTKRVGHATERNRIKRRLRAALAEAGAPYAAAPADVVVIARRNCLGAEFPVLLQDLARALGQVTRPKGPRTGAAKGSPEPSAAN